MVAAGLTEPQIADRLGLSLQTIKNHKQAIYHKLGAANAAHMVLILSNDIPDLVA